MARAAKVVAPAVTRVDPGGITLHGGDDRVLDVLFDERRIWSFWSRRDTVSTDVPEQRHVAWPRPLRRYLDGAVRVTVRSHVDGVEAYAAELAFGTGTERIRVVNDRGIELGIDKSGRMQMTFETRSKAQVGPLLDSVELVLAALREAGVEAFPAYGTLLGAVRDGALIGHDSDADLGYVSRHTHPVDVVRESFELQRHLAQAGLEVVRYSGAGFKVLVAEVDGNTRGLDVFGGFLDGGMLVLMGEIRVPFRPEWIFPLGTTSLEGRTLPAPAEPGRLLEAAYGPSWGTPDPAFKFATPASTTRRLNGWFRGSSVHRSDWDRKYQSKRRQPPSRVPDPLARFVHRSEPDADLIVDVGCGRGVDAYWLARRGVQTLGLDFSPRAFELLDRRAQRRGLPLEYAAMNLLELRHALGWGAVVGATPGRRVVMARHTLDALTRPGRENLYRFLELACGGGGRAYLEFLVTPTQGDGWAQRNLLTTVRAADVAAALTARGGRVVSRRIVGPPGMGITVGEDPVSRARRACRMVVEWPA